MSGSVLISVPDAQRKHTQKRTKTQRGGYAFELCLTRKVDDDYDSLWRRHIGFNQYIPFNHSTQNYENAPIVLWSEHFELDDLDLAVKDQNELEYRLYLNGVRIIAISKLTVSDVSFRRFIDHDNGGLVRISMHNLGDGFYRLIISFNIKLFYDILVRDEKQISCTDQLNVLTRFVGNIYLAFEDAIENFIESNYRFSRWNAEKFASSAIDLYKTQSSMLINVCCCTVATRKTITSDEHHSPRLRTHHDDFTWTFCHREAKIVDTPQKNLIFNIPLIDGEFQDAEFSLCVSVYLLRIPIVATNVNEVKCSSTSDHRFCVNITSHDSDDNVVNVSEVDVIDSMLLMNPPSIYNFTTSAKEISDDAGPLFLDQNRGHIMLTFENDMSRRPLLRAELSIPDTVPHCMEMVRGMDYLELVKKRRSHLTSIDRFSDMLTRITSRKNTIRKNAYFEQNEQREKEEDFDELTTWCSKDEPSSAALVQRTLEALFLVVQLSHVRHRSTISNILVALGDNCSCEFRRGLVLFWLKRNTSVAYMVNRFPTVANDPERFISEHERLRLISEVVDSARIRCVDATSFDLEMYDAIILASREDCAEVVELLLIDYGINRFFRGDGSLKQKRLMSFKCAACVCAAHVGNIQVLRLLLNDETVLNHCMPRVRNHILECSVCNLQRESVELISQTPAVSFSPGFVADCESRIVNMYSRARTSKLVQHMRNVCRRVAISPE
jgi:hypothetical protein